MRNARGRPRSDRETQNTMVWCETCRYMHAPDAHACRHDYRDGDVCSKCGELKGK